MCGYGTGGMGSRRSGQSLEGDGNIKMDMELIQRPFGIYEKAIKPQEWEKMFADASSAGYQNYEISLDESDARLAPCTGMTSNTKR